MAELHRATSRFAADTWCGKAESLRERTKVFVQVSRCLSLEWPVGNVVQGQKGRYITVLLI